MTPASHTETPVSVAAACQGRLADPPPWCCPEPSAEAQRSRVERRARWAAQANGGDSIDLAHAAAQREHALLEIELELAERRYERLACGLEWLDSDIDATRRIRADYGAKHRA